jgi:hypothetical protein
VRRGLIQLAIDEQHDGGKVADAAKRYEVIHLADALGNPIEAKMGTEKFPAVRAVMISDRRSRSHPPDPGGEQHLGARRQRALVLARRAIVRMRACELCLDGGPSRRRSIARSLLT